MTDNLHQVADRRLRWEEGYVRTRRNIGRRRRRIRRLVDASPRGRFLELGCGDGLNLQVARELGFGPLFGMDYSLDLVLASPVRPVLVGDGHRLPFADESLDTVFVDSVLHHLTDYEAAARECFRVLAPGGRLYYFEPRPSVLRRVLDALTMSRFLSLLSYFSSRRETLLEEWDLYQTWLRTHGDMKRFLLGAGLVLRYDKKGPVGMFLSFERPSTSPGGPSHP